MGRVQTGANVSDTEEKHVNENLGVTFFLPVWKM